MPISQAQRQAFAAARQAVLDRIDRLDREAMIATVRLINDPRRSVVREIKAAWPESYYATFFGSELHEISRNLLSVAPNQTKFLVTGFPAKLRRRVASEIEALRADTVVGWPPIEYQAERIARTEVGRIQSEATKLRFGQYSRLGVNLYKRWLSPMDPPRARVDHM